MNRLMSKTFRPIYRCFHNKPSPYNSHLTDKHISDLKLILSESGLKTEELEQFNIDWLKLHKGAAQVAMLPSNTEQLSEVLKYCNQQRLKVVVQGGNTGLVAGAVPVLDELVLSLSKMNHILSFDSLSGVVQCEAGCVLQTLEDYVKKHGYTLPLDLGAKGSCHVGGNMATNAGGLRVIRYGSLHGSCLGLEVVTADGHVLDMMSTLRKDNTGYDLKQLFIGAEGTLGVISKVSLLLPPLPTSNLVAVLAVSSFDDLLKIYRLSRKVLSEQLSAFEMMDNRVMEIVQDKLSLQSPFDSPFYVLIELAGGNQEDLERRFEQLSELLYEKNLLNNGTYSSEPGKMARLWELRERIADALVRQGYCFKYDFSLPLVNFYELVEKTRERMKSFDQVTSVSGYGHVGDSNIHLTITCDTYDEKVHAQLEPWVYEWIQEKKGSVSAEHGLGLKKNAHVQYSKSNECIQLMKKMKNLLDPNGILNPDKMFTQDKA